MFRKMPFLLVAIIVLVELGGHWIPPFYQSLLYGLSLSIKSGIVFILPSIIFCLLFKAAVSFAGQATKMIGLVIALICSSNFFSTLLSYSVGHLVYQGDFSLQLPVAHDALIPIGEIAIPSLVGNAKAVFSGILLGILFGKFRPPLAHRIASRLDQLAKGLLKGILYMIPLFITGFIVKIHHDELMAYIIDSYAWIFALTALSVFAYITLLYYLFLRRGALGGIKNMMPAAIAGFGSMSSASAMPLTILGAEKNAANPAIARAVIPTTVNVHLIGDCFAIPIFAFAVLKSFGVAEPTFLNYLIFAGYFVLAKFSVAAVPGGGILVMLPILEAYLGFNGEMLSLVTALYILFDPVITAANILGNGAFAKGTEWLLGYKKLKQPKPYDWNQKITQEFMESAIKEGRE